MVTNIPLSCPERRKVATQSYSRRAPNKIQRPCLTSPKTAQINHSNRTQYHRYIQWKERSLILPLRTRPSRRCQWAAVPSMPWRSAFTWTLNEGEILHTRRRSHPHAGGGQAGKKNTWESRGRRDIPVGKADSEGAPTRAPPDKMHGATFPYHTEAARSRRQNEKAIPQPRHKVQRNFPAFTTMTDPKGTTQRMWGGKYREGQIIASRAVGAFFT